MILIKMEKKSKIIYLVTTYKCSACKCQEHLLKKALEDRQDIELKICDCSDIPEWLNNKVAFLDFPTTVFIKDNIVRCTIVGTLSVSKIKSRIKDISF